MFNDNRILEAQSEISNLKSDAKRWKVIGVALFFVGIGVGWLLNIFL